MAAKTFQLETEVFVRSINQDAARRVAEAARAGRAKIEAERPVKPSVTTFVDGNKDAQPEAVKPGGVVTLLFDYRAEIVSHLFEEIKARAPVRSGNYLRSHYVMLDGDKLDYLTVPTAAQIKNVQRITVTNDRPYAMRIEVGKMGGGAFLLSGDLHILESSMKAVRREYNGVAKFTFAAIDIVGGHTRQFSSGVRINARRGRGMGTSIQYPAIHIDKV